MKRYYFGPEETAASSEATNVFHQRLDFEICVETKMYLCGNENVFVWKWECIWLVNEKIFARPLLAVCGLRLSALAVRGHSSQQQVGKRRRGGGEKRRKKRKKEKEEKENRETTSTALKKSNWPTNFTFHIFESCQSKLWWSKCGREGGRVCRSTGKVLPKWKLSSQTRNMNLSW